MIIAKARCQAANATGAALFGRFEEAAAIHASIARLYWRHGMYDQAVQSIENATKYLLDAGMEDEASEGIRITTVMLIQKRQPTPALRLSNYVKYLELRYPQRFWVSSKPFCSFVYQKCMENNLIL